VARATLEPRLLVPATLVAALLVIAGSIGQLAWDLPKDPATARYFAAPELNFVMGAGDADGDRVTVDQFSDGYALLSSGPISLHAQDYRFVLLAFESPLGGSVPIFFWRSSDAPGELVRLPVREQGPVLIDLSGQPGWRGEISEFGFLFEEAGTAYSVGPVALEPDRLGLRLQLTWGSWTAFERWSQKSINFLQGGQPEQPLRLPLILTAWLALTMILNWLFSRRLGGDPARLWAGAAVVFLAAWMVLDVRWTANSIRQAGQTLETYGSASDDERLGRGPDGIVYGLISRLKADVLPLEPARILIVGDEQALEYYLQRAKYHLLPHSVYATRRFPTNPQPSSLDYVIFLGQADGMRGIRGWGPSWEVSLRLVDRSELAQVFAVLKDAD